VAAKLGNPYFSHLYKINFNGKGLTLLTPEDGNHTITFSPDYQYFVDSYSKPDVAPVIVLRDMNGKLLSTLEKTDISRLVATGWKAPIPVKLKAHDGTTDIYGLVFTPTKMDANKKYPVIDYIYPGRRAVVLAAGHSRHQETITRHWPNWALLWL
jgi:dipeptidyl aminopeptidase/acylaminoacyl peptidase